VTRPSAGYLFPVGEPARLADAILSTFANPFGTAAVTERPADD
jgi:hypothetical protein